MGAIPYGYCIVDGRAMVDHDAAVKLKQYFRLYLRGESMASAAKEAGLPVSKGTYPHLFERKEYAGTDFYPAIITPEYQEKLIAKRNRQKLENYGKGNGRRVSEKRVPICTDFRLRPGMIPADMADCDPILEAEKLYQRIVPKGGMPEKENRTH